MPAAGPDHSRGDLPGPPHLGHRVSVRHRLPDGSATDVVGRVVEVDALTVVVERRDGTEQPVTLTDVVAWRVVPARPTRPRPAGSIEPRNLLRLASLGWPALETDRLGDWELRASRGFTSRACSAAVLGEPGVGAEEADRVVRDFYARRSMPALVQLVVDDPWESRLADRGWVPLGGPRGGALTLVADLPRTPGRGPDPRVRVDEEPDDAWLSLYARAQDHLATARTVLTSPRTVAFLGIGDPVVAIGRAVVTGTWVGLTCIETRPDRRREGLARAVVDTALAWATERGATSAYLQVTPDNRAALALYAPLGFEVHHRYRFLRAPDGT